MLTTTPPNDYRMGLSVVEIAGYKAYVHEGFWGTVAVHLPAFEATIALSVHQAEARAHWPLATEIATTLTNTAVSP